MAGPGTPPRLRGGEPRVPAIHVLPSPSKQGVDARHKAGHDGRCHWVSRRPVNFHCDSSSMA
jgi:hypothetical protein